MINLGIGVAWKANRLAGDGAVPINITPPVISGSLNEGQTLTSTTGTWASDTGVTEYLYQWYRGSEPIIGATNSTYIISMSDLGFGISCYVAATDSDGTSMYVQSNVLLVPFVNSLSFNSVENSQYYSTYFY